MRKNKLLLIGVLSTISGIHSLSAYAQSTSMSSQPPVGIEATKASKMQPQTVKSDSSAKPLVNPFNGKSLTYEQLQLEVERKKLETTVLEEELRQAGIRKDISAMPVKAEAEIKQFQTSIKSETQKQKAIEIPATPVATNQTTSSKEKKSTKTKKTSEKDTDQQIQPAKIESPAPVFPVVKSVMSSKSGKSAILEVNGQLISADDGDNTPFGKLTIVDNQTVMIDGKKQKISNSTISRVASVVTEQKNTTTSTSQLSPASNTAIPATLNIGANGIPVPALPPSLSGNSNRQLQMPPLTTPATQK